MTKPRLLDLFCGDGGAAVGYARAGFDPTGVDNQPQPHYPFDFVQADALEFLAEHGHEFDAIHASPPCQAYSIMHNLPRLAHKDYPTLILPTREMLDAIGKPYVIENVMGARHGAKGLKKRGLEAHGLKAGWLCGAMFGLPFYRHRLFATNWFWLAPGHPKHTQRIRSGSSLGGRARDIVFSPRPRGTWEKGYEQRNPDRSNQARETAGRDKQFVYSEAEDSRGIETWPGRRGIPAGLAVQDQRSLAAWQQGNGAQAAGVGIGHAKGWHLAAEAMGIDWMTRAELTQAIPPAYTEFVGRQLLRVLR